MVRADLLDRGCPAHPGGRGLEDLELGGARDGLLEQLGVGQGDRGVGREGRDEGHVAARPGPRGSRVSADSAPMTRPLWISGATRWPAKSGTPWYRRPRRADRHGCRQGQDVARPEDLADAALVAAEGRQRGTRRRRPDRPRRSTSRRSSRSSRMVGRVGARGPASSRRRSSGRASARSCEAASRPAIPRTVSRRSASSASGLGVGARRRRSAAARRRRAGHRAGRPLAADEPAEDRAAAVAPRAEVARGGRRRPVPDGRFVWSFEARAHGPMVPPRPGVRGGAPSVPVGGRTIVPVRRRSVDRFESGRTTLRERRGPWCPRPSDPASEADTSPWTTVPVPSAASAPPIP